MYYMESDNDLRELMGKLDDLWKSDDIVGEVNAVLPKAMNMIEYIYKELVIHKLAMEDAKKQLVKSNTRCPYDGDGSCNDPKCWEDYLRHRAEHAYKVVEDKYEKTHVKRGKGVSIK